MGKIIQYNLISRLVTCCCLTESVLSVNIIKLLQTTFPSDEIKSELIKYIHFIRLEFSRHVRSTSQKRKLFIIFRCLKLHEPN